MANLIPDVCKLLGIEVNEKFKVKDEEYNDNIFFIDENGDIVITINGKEYYSLYHDIKLIDFLTGEQEIIKLPWKPKKDETYFTLYIAGAFVYVEPVKWQDSMIDFTRHKANLVFRNQKEAQNAIPSFAEEFNLAYEEP